MAPIPIELALSITFGATFAWAGHASIGEHALLRSPALWALMAFLVLLVTPTSVFLLWRYPDWCSMYLFDLASLPIPSVYWAGLFPLIALLTFLVSRQLLIRSKILIVLGLALAGITLAGVIGFMGKTQLLAAATLSGFREHPEATRSLIGSSLGYMVAGSAAAHLVAWGVATSRLFLLGQAMNSRILEGEASEPLVRRPRTSPRSEPPAAKGKRQGRRGSMKS